MREIAAAKITEVVKKLCIEAAWSYKTDKVIEEFIKKLE